jgi:hypothetical protein
VACIKICRKIGIPIIALFIPIYNNYVFYKAFGMKKWFWPMFFSSSILAAISSLFEMFKDNDLLGGIVGIVAIVVSIWLCVLFIRYTYNMARAFGKGFIFFLGLMFFPALLYLILAFGKAEYVGVSD